MKFAYHFIAGLVGGVLVCTACAHAAVISFQFGRGGGDNATVGSRSAGVVPVAHWNISNDKNANTGSVSDLLDSDGLSTTADLDWAALSYQQFGVVSSTSTTADQSLFRGGLITYGQQFDNTRINASITLTQIPYAQYDLIVYVQDESSNPSTLSLDGGTAVSYNPNINDDVSTADPLFDPIAPTADTAGNYFRFTNLTGASHTVSIGKLTAGVSGITGFQIVEVPEPASVALLMLGGVLLWRQRR